MKKINLSITGCLGRMGKQLIKSSKRSRDFKIVSITENKKLRFANNKSSVLFVDCLLCLLFNISNCEFGKKNVRFHN